MLAALGVLAALGASAAGASPLASSSAKTIAFSGYTWFVRSSSSKPVGPGPNVFSDSSDNVWVDRAGHLHLKITRHATKSGSTWNCAEVMLATALGYGTYTLRVASPVKRLGDHAVLGFFTWDDAEERKHREVDIELSKWGLRKNENAQYVVVESGAKKRFDLPAEAQQMVFGLGWRPGHLALVSLVQDEQADPGKKSQKKSDEQRWDYANPAVPDTGDAHIKLNLWLFKGAPPEDGRDIEMELDGLDFNPSEFSDVNDGGT